MEKFKEYKYLIALGLVILVSSFYWFQVRPTSIKKECSWVEEVIEADPGVTTEQAEKNKKIFSEQCDTPKSSTGYQGLISPGCWLLEKNSVAREPQPERTEVKNATDDEYRTCLRQHGI